MKDNLFSELVLLYFSGEISEGELIQLDLLLKDKENAEEFKKLVRLHIDTNKALHTTIVDKELILNKLLSHEGNKKSFSYKRWLPYAAVGILFISLGYKLLFPTHKITEQQMNEDAITLQ